MARLAAFVSPGRALERAAARAALAEELGYDLVFDNHIAGADGLMALAAYGAATSTVTLGTGVYPLSILTPVTLAQQAATLDALIGGRLLLGVGTSHRQVLEAWHGQEFPEKPLRFVRESVEALRTLFTTGELHTDGAYVRVPGFRFHGFTPRPDIPIHLSALSPGMLKLAGRIADGVILWLCGPTYIREVVVPTIAEGAREAGRSPDDVQIIAAVSCALGDAPSGRAAFRKVLLPYASLPFYRAALDRAGFADDLARYDAGMADGDVATALAGLSDGLVDHHAGIGTRDDIQSKLTEYRDAGAVPAVGPIAVEGGGSFDDVLAAAAPS